MNTPSISLKRSLNLTIKDTLLRIRFLGKNDSRAIVEEFREWLDACESLDKHPPVLYINQINTDSKKDH